MNNHNFLLLIENFLKDAPTHEKSLKYIAKFIRNYGLKIPEKFLIYLRDDINDINFSQKKYFFEILISFILMNNHDFEFMQEYFESLLGFLYEEIESLPYKILTIVSLIHDIIILPEDFISDIIEKNRF